MLVLSACLPRLTGIQGRLLDAEGNAINGTADMVFDYWTCASGGEGDSGCDKVYSETKNDVLVDEGLFDVSIGTSSLNADEEPDPSIFARRLWVEITVNGETLTPRQKLLGSPYAHSLVGGAVVFSLHQGPGGTDGTDENYGSLSVVSGGAKGTSLVLGNGQNGGDFLRACASPLGGSTNRECTDLRFRISNTGNVSADGAFTGGGADFAEYINATGSRRQYEPGDVLVIRPDQDRAVELSSAAYSTAVIGVFSTDPALLGGGKFLPDNGVTDMLPVGIIGIVPVKVSAENGPIHRGDMLTTSSIPGHAMLASEFVPGSILGKAMGELDEGTGVIEVVLLLQ